MIKHIVWQIDIFIYKLFYWRWRNKLENRSDIRQLFLRYLNSWEALHNEPCMGVGGNPPELKTPNQSFNRNCSEKPSQSG